MLAHNAAFSAWVECGNFRYGPHLLTRFGRGCESPRRMARMGKWIMDIEDMSPLPLGRFPTGPSFGGYGKRFKRPIRILRKDIQGRYELEYDDDEERYVEVYNDGWGMISALTNTNLVTTEASRVWLEARGYLGVAGDQQRRIDSGIVMEGDCVRDSVGEGSKEGLIVMPWCSDKFSC
ncbi:hypothetical protein P153DRAFT_397250 [Dothidotthia symphoricarpi CBS 119687]|uniref:Uncharacterized protein n=1 Tax=Dothidotthia symphoricarpi CBS 119687 TaxID=1392245 RepID=A0A6A6ADU2_9PLEO|nr:uncharacterized protein P153DRAFT_397250 [Dothidotthia symphoricarpi CBS 119687]KAF2129057.1 hypothetical protein P153DRAFT_397250 [Dothidotthia symphoricarpi CBS 119687]